MLDDEVGRVPQQIDDLTVCRDVVDLGLDRRDLDDVFAVSGVESELALDHRVEQVFIITIWEVGDVNLLIIQGILEIA